MSAVRDAARAIPTLLRVGFSSAVAYRSEFLIWEMDKQLDAAAGYRGPHFQEPKNT